MKVNELSVIRLAATNDRNGNSRRVFLVLHPEQGILVAINEGGRGFPALLDVGTALGQALGRTPYETVETTPAGFRAAVKDHGLEATGKVAEVRREMLLALGRKMDAAVKKQKAKS